MNLEHYRKMKIQNYLQSNNIDAKIFWYQFDTFREHHTFNCALIKSMLMLVGKKCIDDLTILTQ